MISQNITSLKYPYFQQSDPFFSFPSQGISPARCSAALWPDTLGKNMLYHGSWIKLNDLLKKSGLSKNMLIHQAGMQQTQINNYCRNQITRLDIDVLGKLCTVLNCEIGDLLEFVPPAEKKE